MSLKRVDDAKSLAELEVIEQELFGRKEGIMTQAFRELGTLRGDEKKQRGKELNEQKTKLESAIAKKYEALQSTRYKNLAKQERIDMTLDLPKEKQGHLHLIPEFIHQAEEVFGRMGFDVAYGDEIETEETNFDLLNFAKDHPARDTQDIFYLDAHAKDKALLRSQTSPVQIHYMREHKPPFRMICPGKVYRSDADATHSPMFHQIEGLMVGRDVSLANMKAVMAGAIRELMGRDSEFRFRTGYFPFVEPGLEVDIRWQGDTQTREGEWLEVAGCGMVHPNVLKNVDIDPKTYQGFAFGFGVERLLMIKHQIPNIKLFYEGNERFLHQF